MEDRTRDIRELILERVFPDLRFGGDPDIERYFDLRASGRMLDALGVYRSRLLPRYPDEAKRIVLLKLYRTRSPAFPDFLRGLLMERADEIVARLRRNIDALVAPIAGVRMQDTYAVLKAVESVARFLPEDSDDARQMAWTYAEYAKLLDHRAALMDRAAYLLGEFYAQAAVERDEARDFVGESYVAEEESRREREKKNFFDLSKIDFDEADVRRIEIPAGLERDEDAVLAYCHKYWLAVDDSAFERIIWLYSRKYGTKHYDVFKAIKIARRKKYSDDDILTTVATTIATTYNYTVQGDLYMQAAWRQIKASLYARPDTAAEPEPAAVQPARGKRRKATKAKSRTRRAAAPRAAPRSTARAAAPAKTAAAARPRLTKAPARPLMAREPARKQANANLDLKATGSISDRIKRLSGRAYDVYKDIFLAKVRLHIRDELLRRRDRQAKAFGGDTNRAENLVYDFMERNYTNSYMDWPSSEHRKTILELGFDLPSLDGIIDACYRKISA